MAGRRHETPLPRTNPSGKKVWVARYTKRNGKRGYAGTYKLQREAQDAIDAAYDREYGDGDGRAPRQVGTVEAYVEHWQRIHPRSLSTARTYGYNLNAVLDVKVGGTALRLWPIADVERSEVAEILDHLLKAGRAAAGARGVLRTLGAMWEDAISDGWTKHNPVAGLRVRRSDPRVQKRARTPHVYSWQQMHGMADMAPTPQATAMVRCLSDLGLRLGEMLPLERGDIDGDWVWVRRTATDGSVTLGTKTTRDEPEKARRAPLPLELRDLLRGLPPRLDTRLLFPAPRGRVMQQREFYRVWDRLRVKAGMPEARPHDFRHGYVSLMRAAGVDPAHLADWTGHTVLTATTTYTHAVGDVSDIARRVASGSHGA